MNIVAIKTHAIRPHEPLLALIDAYLPAVKEQSILAITSKIVSLTEGSVVAKDDTVSKLALIRSSSDAYLDQEAPHGVQITIKNGMLLPSSGIDESNGDGYYILYPRDIQKSAMLLWNHIRKRDNIRQFGVIITDSRTSPMRRGVTGVAIGWCGFQALYSYIDKPDCFNKPLRVTMTNVLDSLACSAVFCMGEGNEQTPLALIQEAPKVIYQDRAPSQAECQELVIPMEDDLYAPLLLNPHWVYPTS